MTPEEIRDIVRETLRELQKQGMLREQWYTKISKRLRDYYKAVPGMEDRRITEALNEIRSDPYYEVIPLHYNGCVTLEDIAEIRGVDVSTITRNKKRLCMMIYEYLENRP